MFKDLIIKGEAISHLSSFDKITNLDLYKSHINHKLNIKNYISSGKIFEDIEFVNVPKFSSIDKKVSYTMELYSKLSENEYIDLKTLEYVSKYNIQHQPFDLELYYTIERDEKTKKYTQIYLNYNGDYEEYTSDFVFKKDPYVKNLVYDYDNKKSIIRIEWLNKLREIPYLKTFHISDFNNYIENIRPHERLNIYKVHAPYIELNRKNILEALNADEKLHNFIYN